MKNVRSSRGFTLIELLVVIAIIAGLAGFLIPQFSSFSRSSDLQNAAAQLESTLRNAQSNAASGVGCNSTVSAATWSIKFDVSSARSYRLETSCVGPTPGPGTPTPTPVAVHNFPAGVSIEQITFNSGCTVDMKDSQPKVIFTNISGAVSFDGGSGCQVYSSSTQLTIRLGSTSATEKRDIKVEKGGSIYVQSN